ncbi:MAG: hypothetical protein IPP51_16410 [Bacteroidetes bacterium]|nr:hypothetical protein [Bacteroidota bacterium]
MGAITIKEVLTKADQKEFFAMAHRIYADYPAWVAPLNMEVMKIWSDKYPFRDHSEMKFFLAIRDGQTVGRIAAIVDSDFIKKWTQRIGHFGFFESVNDIEVARALFNTAESFLKERKITMAQGPMNPSTNYTCGMLLNAFDMDPYLDMTYNPPYYLELLEKLGYSKNCDLNAYFYTKEEKMQKRLATLGAYICQKNGISIRPINMKAFKAEQESLREIYNDAWDDNFGFVPVSQKEFGFITGQMKDVAIPDLVLIAYIHGQLAGFIAALPDYNRFMKPMKGKLTISGLYNLLFNKKKIKATRVITFGIKKQFRKKGLDVALLNQLMINWTAHKFEEAELSWILEHNYQMIHEIEKFGAKHYKTYRLYEKKL